MNIIYNSLKFFTCPSAQKCLKEHAVIGLVDTPISLGESRSNLMASSILYSVCAIIALVSTVSGQEGGTCQACNCQLNNVEVLNRLIESHMRSGKLRTCSYYQAKLYNEIYFIRSPASIWGNF